MIECLLMMFFAVVVGTNLINVYLILDDLEHGKRRLDEALSAWARSRDAKILDARRATGAERRLGPVAPGRQITVRVLIKDRTGVRACVLVCGTPYLGLLKRIVDVLDDRPASPGDLESMTHWI